MVLRLDANGISGLAAIYLAASSTVALNGIADVVLGVGHTVVASVALYRVWLAAVVPGRRQLTALSMAGALRAYSSASP